MAMEATNKTESPERLRGFLRISTIQKMIFEHTKIPRHFAPIQNYWGMVNTISNLCLIYNMKVHMVCFNFGSPKNKGTNLKENDHGEEEIRKQSGFVFPIRIP